MMGEKFTYSEYFFVCYEQEGYHADEGYLLFEGWISKPREKRIKVDFIKENVTAWKLSKYGVFLVPILPYSVQVSGNTD